MLQVGATGTQKERKKDRQTDRYNSGKISNGSYT
jgi:hypothetical protein